MTLLSRLSVETRMSGSDIEQLIQSAPKRYKVYQIPKRSGGRRTIAHPAREVKTLQRALIRVAPRNLSVHESSTAYEVGTSILDNARRHSQADWIARFDFYSFFNSITADSWDTYLVGREASDEFRLISRNAFFWQPKGQNSLCLSVGAPSSPFVSNRIMHDFDSSMSTWCVNEGFLYTRYADDLTVSSDRRFETSFVADAIARSMPSYLDLRLNEKKTRIAGPGSRKVVTGLIVTDLGAVTIGKRRRKLVEALVHHHISGTASLSNEEILGHLAFLKHVEPAAYEKIKQKFSPLVPALFPAGD